MASNLVYPLKITQRDSIFQYTAKYEYFGILNTCPYTGTTYQATFLGRLLKVTQYMKIHGKTPVAIFMYPDVHMADVLKALGILTYLVLYPGWTDSADSKDMISRFTKAFNVAHAGTKADFLKLPAIYRFVYPEDVVPEYLFQITPQDINTDSTLLIDIPAYTMKEDRVQPVTVNPATIVEEQPEKHPNMGENPSASIIEEYTVNHIKIVEHTLPLAAPEGFFEYDRL